MTASPIMVLSLRRLVAISIAVVISLHYLLVVVFKKDIDVVSTVTDFGGRIGLTKPASKEPTNILFSPPPQFKQSTSEVALPNTGSERANATFVFLCRNSDLAGVVSSIQQMEDRFNRKHGYPWVLLNEEPFTEEFKTRVEVLTNSPVHFGVIPPEHWYQPDWIDEEQAKAGRLRMTDQGIIYGGSVPYRNMCRFNSGFFFHHELLKPYKYYWRVEPEVKYFCDLDYDPFKFMEENKKVYGFTIALLEWEPTITTLWKHVKEFSKKYPEYINPKGSMEFLSDDQGESYNLCHYWSNFEIADMDFWRSDAYQAFFEHLESTGGFYYERWGDAPVHSIAASLLARKDQIHFFEDIGYRHEWIQHCPNTESWWKGKCACDPSDSFDDHYNSCLSRYKRMFS
ncbi:nucleotide-diphospho-sugar transferase [Crepidotus variabilis]|uniref:Nucleotide-diphospho-sugar transferase n=1 Tax=Crepidotus variabilis TaxID=179855 RepID=A0A9P6EQA3_9AGAR|nr:nucleotide-diphospho-sugar transferase [Crepidotus variabilis]